MDGESPAFSFYAKDFMLSTVTMSLAERGAYITLLAYQWDRGSVPADSPSLARLWGCTSSQAKAFWRVIGQKFVAGEDGQWRNARLEQERVKQAERRERLAANGKLGGRPRKATGNQNETKRFSKTEPTENQNERLPSPSPSPISQPEDVLEPKPSEVVASATWELAKAKIQADLNPEYFERWMGRLEVWRETERELELRAPSVTIASWVKQHHQKLITDALGGKRWSVVVKPLATRSA